MRAGDNYQALIIKIREKALSCGRSPQDIQLVAVSKTCTLDDVFSAYQAGARNFGESRMLEVLAKIPQMPEDCRWHFIGKLQGNKVKKGIGFFDLIHSVDTPDLAKKISEAGKEQGVVTPILLQVNTSGEKSKQGFSTQEWERELDMVNQLPNLSIRGVMTIAPYVKEEHIIRACFRKLFEFRERWKGRMRDPNSFTALSMGMTHDYLIAIEEGATLLRIGSAVFGEREGHQA